MRLISLRGRRSPSLVPNYFILTLLAIFAFGPILVLLFNSVKTTAQIASNPLSVPLGLIHWENFPKAWARANYSTVVMNSVVITGSTVLGVLIIAGLAAYSLGRLKPIGGNLLTVLLLAGTSMPIQLFLVPLYFTWAKARLINNPIGVILIYWALYSPFATFLIRSFMVGVPNDFIDAARVDGASEFQILKHVMVPIIWPGILTAGLVTGLSSWNEFLISLTFLQKPAVRTATLGLYSFATDNHFVDLGLLNAGAVILVLPVIILFLSLQRQFIYGLTQGGLKA